MGKAACKSLNRKVKMKYHKIQTVYKRDPETKYKYLLEGQFATPEFEYLAGNRWIFTEKIDGTNIRVEWYTEAEFGPSIEFKGRTDRAQVPPFLMSRLKILLPAEKLEKEYPDVSMVLYGEGYGAKIQKGGGNYIPDGVDFILFDVKIGNVWLKRADVKDIAEKLQIGIVPIFGGGTLGHAITLTRRGLQSKIGTQIMEGLVMRPEIELNDRMGRRIISKIKYKDFPR